MGYCVAQVSYQQVEHTSCCYGQTTFSEGQTVDTIPACCLSLHCHRGNIVKRYARPGHSACCEFDGQMYAEGDKLSSYCVELTCRDGNWTYSNKIEECCQQCQLYDNSHLTTFDNYHYDWHGVCNYSLTQNDTGYYPDVAVYSDFQPCFSTVSCLHTTTFKNDEHTAITITHDNIHGSSVHILVNGRVYYVREMGVHAVESSTTHPVLAWRDGECIMMIGSSRIMVRACRHSLYIWAYPTHTNQLNGLCGHFNFYVGDDMTNRDGTVHTLHPWPVTFPESWKTNEQTKQQCQVPCYNCAETTEDPCRVSASQRDPQRQCRRLLHPLLGNDYEELQNYIESCKKDLCLARQDGQSIDQLLVWLTEVIILVQTAKTVHTQTTGTWRPQPHLTAAIDCTPGSEWKQDCYWCRCTVGGSAMCDVKPCDEDYVHPAGTAACLENSAWRDDCKVCWCVNGGVLCSPPNCMPITIPTTSSTSPPIDTQCFLPRAVGTCGDRILQYYYNPMSGTCEPFYYSGCGGNDNRFSSFKLCLAVCGAYIQTIAPPTTTPPTTIGVMACFYLRDPGPCQEALTRYYYNMATRRCETFIYGGCEGNPNNFASEAHCQRVCGHLGATTPAPPTTTAAPPTMGMMTCFYRRDPGPCQETIMRYYFNIVERKCEIFIYGGCDGNPNNFASDSDCERVCGHLVTTTAAPPPTTAFPPMGMTCFLPSDSGPCQDYMVRYYFNLLERKCKTFIYGGCEGNPNNFALEADCERVCGHLGTGTATATATATPTGAQCLLPKDEGTCSDRIPQYYYNTFTASCELFYYSGCGGNDNRFTSMEGCLFVCRNVPTDTTIATPPPTNNFCYLPKAEGTCHLSIVQYYYNPMTGTCEQFHYSGCGGNNNRFSSFEFCVAMCVTTQGPVMPTTLSSKCYLPMSLGHCFDTIPQYFYNHVSEMCERFYYSGCGGNANRFSTEGECRESCPTPASTPSPPVTQSTPTTTITTAAPSGPDDQCMLPVLPVSCTPENTMTIYFDNVDGRCQEHAMGICSGNSNGFLDKMQCVEACVLSVTFK